MSNEVAQIIISQLGGTNRLRIMTGAYNFASIPNGVSFRVKSRKANYIKIILVNDLYNIEIGRILGRRYSIIKDLQGVYADQLKPIIEETTGMYLTLANGGEIEPFKFTFKTNQELNTAQMSGSVPEYDIVRFEVKYGDKKIVDFPAKTEEEYFSELKLIPKRGGKILKVYQDKMEYSSDDYDYDDNEDFADGGIVIDDKRAKDFDDEDRSWWSDRYKEVNGTRPRRLSDAELIQWANDNFVLQGKEIILKKSGDTDVELESFDLSNLDPYETMLYNNYIKSMPKAEVLQVIINSVEGDYSQLSKELSDIAQRQDSFSKMADGGVMENSPYEKFLLDNGFEKAFERKGTGFVEYRKGRWYCWVDKKTKEIEIGKYDSDISYKEGTLSGVREDNSPLYHTDRYTNNLSKFKNFLDDNYVLEMADGGEVGDTIIYKGDEIYIFTVPFGHSWMQGLRDFFNEHDGKVNKKIWDDTLDVLKDKKAFAPLSKNWKEYKKTFEVKVEDGFYVNPFYYADGGNIEEYPPVELNKFVQTLKELIKSSPKFDESKVRYIDSCTTDRTGFDFYSFKYWGKTSVGSISAIAAEPNRLYYQFRKLDKPKSIINDKQRAILQKDYDEAIKNKKTEFVSLGYDFTTEVAKDWLDNDYKHVYADGGVTKSALDDLGGTEMSKGTIISSFNKYGIKISPKNITITKDVITVNYTGEPKNIDEAFKDIASDLLTSDYRFTNTQAFFYYGKKMADGGKVGEEEILYEVDYEEQKEGGTDNETRSFTDKDAALRFAKANYSTVDYQKTINDEIVEIGYVNVKDGSLVPRKKYADGGNIDGANGINNVVKIVDTVKPVKSINIQQDRVVLYFDDEVTPDDAKMMNHYLQEIKEHHDIIEPEVLYAFKEKGKTDFNSVFIKLKTDEEFENGGVTRWYTGKNPSNLITVVSEADKYTKGWGRKGKRDNVECVGAFDIKNWKGDYGYLYELTDYEKDFWKNVPLKQHEKLFRYESDATKIGKMMPVIKINIEKALIYFLKDLYSDDDKNLVFEKRGVKPLFISLHEKVYKMADGGNVSGNDVKVEEDMNGFFIVYKWYGSWITYSRHRFKADAEKIKSMLENGDSGEEISKEIEKQSQSSYSKKINRYEKYEHGGKLNNQKRIEAIKTINSDGHIDVTIMENGKMSDEIKCTHIEEIEQLVSVHGAENVFY